MNAPDRDPVIVPERVDPDSPAASTARQQGQPISVLVCALGGEGGGVLAEWLVAVARQAGHAAQSSSIPGVAQRTGATTYYLEFAPLPRAALGGRDPLFALAPVPGQLQLLVGSELLECARQAAAGLTAPGETVVIASTARALTTLERMHGGDGRLDAATLEDVLRRQSRALHLLDMAGLTREAGTVVSSVLLGCIAASGVLPFARAHFEAVVGAGGARAAASQRGFALGYAQVAALVAAREAARVAAAAGSPQVSPAATSASATPRAPQAPHATDEPLTLDALASLGEARVVEYQDAAYGRLYRERLARVQAAEATADPQAQQAWAASYETARWLALWMAFDDVVRVADLKSRAGRSARVRREAQAGAYDVLKVYDHFKPGVPEFAALLPPTLARRLQHWDAARLQRGLPPWALPLKIGTHTIGGLLALRLLASLRRLRRHGQRFAQEQALIERWLAGVEQGLGRSARLGLEVARCGRLIKGYGSTSERGKERLLHVLDHLLPLPGDADTRAAAIAQVREAALDDASGRRFNTELQAHGAKAQAPREQPVRWVRRTGR